METNLENQTHTCSCCHRNFPRAAFYINKHTQRPDRYCKECRKALSKTRHRNSLIVNSHPTLVITDIADTQFRMSLIRHALLLVKASIERKSKKRREQEDREEGIECYREVIGQKCK